MPKNFLCYQSNGEYSVGSTGGMLYIYDKDEKELARIKTMLYTYELLFFPDGKRFIARSNEGLIAVYDLQNFSLIKKFRYGKAVDPHDQNLSLSKDGKLLYAIVYTFDKKRDCPNTWIDVYETENFTIVKRLFTDFDDFCPHYIELVSEEDAFYLLGGWSDNFALALLKDDVIVKTVRLTNEQEWSLNEQKTWELSGFSNRIREIWHIPENAKKIKNPLAAAWQEYSKKNL